MACFTANTYAKRTHEQAFSPEAQEARPSKRVATEAVSYPLASLHGSVQAVLDLEWASWINQALGKYHLIGEDFYEKYVSSVTGPYTQAMSTTPQGMDKFWSGENKPQPTGGFTALSIDFSGATPRLDSLGNIAAGPRMPTTVKCIKIANLTSGWEVITPLLKYQPIDWLILEDCEIQASKLLEIMRESGEERKAPLGIILPSQVKVSWLHAREHRFQRFTGGPGATTMFVNIGNWAEKLQREAEDKANESDVDEGEDEHEGTEEDSESDCESEAPELEETVVEPVKRGSWSESFAEDRAALSRADAEKEAAIAAAKKLEEENESLKNQENNFKKTKNSKVVAVDRALEEDGNNTVDSDEEQGSAILHSYYEPEHDNTSLFEDELAAKIQAMFDEDDSEELEEPAVNAAKETEHDNEAENDDFGAQIQAAIDEPEPEQPEQPTITPADEEINFARSPVPADWDLKKFSAFYALKRPLFNFEQAKLEFAQNPKGTDWDDFMVEKAASKVMNKTERMAIFWHTAATSKYTYEEFLKAAELHFKQRQEQSAGR